VIGTQVAKVKKLTITFNDLTGVLQTTSMQKSISTSDKLH